MLIGQNPNLGISFSSSLVTIVHSMGKISIDLHLDSDGTPLKERKLIWRNKFYVDFYKKEYILFTSIIKMSYSSKDLNKFTSNLRKHTMQQYETIFNEQKVDSIVGGYFWKV
jgi:hypothetical protein